MGPRIPSTEEGDQLVDTFGGYVTAATGVLMLELVTRAWWMVKLVGRMSFGDFFGVADS